VVYTYILYHLYILFLKSWYFWPEINGILALPKNLDLYIQNANEDNVGYLCILILNNFNICLLNSSITLYNVIQFYIQYLILSFLRFHTEYSCSLLTKFPQKIKLKLKINNNDYFVYMNFKNNFYAFIIDIYYFVF
jgi:hypothetical protein